jgi:penicillin amidase
VLADKARLMPKQFTDARFEPRTDWTGYDVAMIWVGTMANRYSNASSEIANLRLPDQLSKARGARVGRQILDQIRWIEDPLAPTTVPRVEVSFSDDRDVEPLPTILQGMLTAEQHPSHRAQTR